MSRSTLGDLVRLLRHAQWVKNVIVLAGPVAAQRINTLDGARDTALTLIAFCLAASCIYALNDVIDRKADALHPSKRARPVARGAVTPQSALSLAGMLGMTAVVLTLLLVRAEVTLVIGGYLLLMIAYSLVLKRCVILDVIVLAIGFVLRAWAGAVAVDVPTSTWLLACVFTLCLFLGFGKRRCEVVTMGRTTNAEQHRATLISYTPDLLNHLTTVSAGIAVVTFLLYTVDRYSPAPFPKEYLFYTLPIVIYGIFRFAMLTELGVYSGPTEIVLKDRGINCAIISWATIAVLIVYLAPQG